MAKVSKQTAKHDDYGPVESWHEEVEGHAIEFVTFKQDIDSTPMLKGLPAISATARTGDTRATRRARAEFREFAACASVPE